GEVGERAAELAAEGVEDRILLRRRRPLVDVDGDGPVAREDVARQLGDVDDVQPADIDTVDLALVEVVADEGVAGAVVGVLADPAGAQHVARAGLEQRAGQAVDDAGPRGGLLRALLRCLGHGSLLVNPRTRHAVAWSGRHARPISLRHRYGRLTPQR